MMLMFVFVIFGMVVILRRILAVLVPVSAATTAMASTLFSVSAMPSVGAVTVSEHMHAHK